MRHTLTALCILTATALQALCAPTNSYPSATAVPVMVNATNLAVVVPTNGAAAFAASNSLITASTLATNETDPVWAAVSNTYASSAEVDADVAALSNSLDTVAFAGEADPLALHIDGATVMAADLPMGGHSITNVAEVGSAGMAIMDCTYGILDWDGVPAVHFANRQLIGGVVWQMPYDSGAADDLMRRAYADTRYVMAETDPVWGAVSNQYATTGQLVSATGTLHTVVSVEIDDDVAALSNALDAVAFNSNGASLTNIPPAAISATVTTNTTTVSISNKTQHAFHFSGFNSRRIEPYSVIVYLVDTNTSISQTAEFRLWRGGETNALFQHWENDTSDGVLSNPQLDSAAAVGTNAVTVASGYGSDFYTNALVWISGPTSEWNRVASIDTDTLTLDYNLTASHTTNDVVSLAWWFQPGPTYLTSTNSMPCEIRFGTNTTTELGLYTEY